MALHWVLSGNIFNEFAWEELIKILDRFEIPYSEHKVVPFVGELMPDPPSDLNGGNVICIGPYSMRHIAKKKGWSPGVFDLEPFSYQTVKSMFPYDLLNGDSLVVKFKDAVWPEDEQRFLRPVNDAKDFAGGVYDWPTMADWKEKICVLKEEDGSTITGESLIQVARTKKIFAEYRCWVVNGKIITMSLYKLGRRVVYENWDNKGPEIWKYAQGIVDEWQPLPAYVLDVCEREESEGDYGRFKIVEMNTLNASGLYAADMQKLIMTLQDAFSK